MLKWSEITAKLSTMKDMVLSFGMLVLAVFMLSGIFVCNRIHRGVVKVKDKANELLSTNM